MHMKKNWTKRNINVDTFKEKIRKFLEENEFEINNDKTMETELCRLEASGSLKYRIEGEIVVIITGTSEDLTLTLERINKSKPKKYSMPMTLTTFLGGGLLLRDEFISDENFLKLKKDLWIFADETVDNLSNPTILPDQERNSHS
jgi:hypothetical protein